MNTARLTEVGTCSLVLGEGRQNLISVHCDWTAVRRRNKFKIRLTITIRVSNTGVVVDWRVNFRSYIAPRQRPMNQSHFTERVI